jgi:predicted outer membrane repeat protein
MNFSGAGTTTQPCIIQNLTIENGYGSGIGNSNPTSNGGAITALSSVVTLSGCILSQNYADNSGGAIYVDSGSTLTVANSSFAFNKAGSYAGAIYNLGTFIAQNSGFTNNTSNNFVGTLYNGGSATLTNCSVQSSQEVSNGAIMNVAGITLTGCTITGNVSSAGNGGLLSTGGELTANACLFSQNSSEQPGGAISTSGNSSNSAVIENCIFADNTATSGGAIYVNGPTNILGCTTTGNSASVSAGGGAVYVGTDGNAVLSDDILWADTSVASNSVNEIYNGGRLSITYSDIDLGATGKGNLDSNPLFLSSSNYRIQASSPCVYSGTSIASLATDYAGRLRHAPPCMGAYEGGSVWSVVDSVIGPDLNKRILWASIYGEAALWTITPSGTHTALAFGPYAGDTPAALAVGPDNHNYLAWELASSEVIVWNIAPDGSHTSRAFNPGTNWNLVSISVGSDSYLHITWQNKPGVVLIWNVSTTGAITVQDYGPE